MSFVVWDQPARVVERARQRTSTEVVRSTRLRIGVRLAERPKPGAHLSVQGWDCGAIETVGWDVGARRYQLGMPDIFVDDGPADQRETDYAILVNAAIAAGWEAIEERVDRPAHRPGLVAARDAAIRSARSNAPGVPAGVSR